MIYIRTARAQNFGFEFGTFSQVGNWYHKVQIISEFLVLVNTDRKNPTTR